MSQTFTRLSKSYLNVARIDIANYFPKNAFIREPNPPKSNKSLNALKIST